MLRVPLPPLGAGRRSRPGGHSAPGSKAPAVPASQADRGSRGSWQDLCLSRDAPAAAALGAPPRGGGAHLRSCDTVMGRAAGSRSSRRQRRVDRAGAAQGLYRSLRAGRKRACLVARLLGRDLPQCAEAGAGARSLALAARALIVPIALASGLASPLRSLDPTDLRLQRDVA